MRLLLCTGGCRSGKSEFARQWAEERSPVRVFMATAYSSGDPEMLARIARHQAARKNGWLTCEAASGPWTEPERLVAEAADMGGVLLFDCLTLWTSLCLENNLDMESTLALTDRLLASFRRCGRSVALVSNEVGMGLVPDTARGREFRDTAGLVNQRAAAVADAVVFMVSGLPLFVKGTG